MAKGPVHAKVAEVEGCDVHAERVVNRTDPGLANNHDVGI